MSEFIDKLTSYGADVTTALERFANDESLYEMCFNLLLDDENFAMLKSSIDSNDYENAFKAGHALKGVIANLELTPLNGPISNLVESLRTNDCSKIDSQYTAVLIAYNELKAL
ncbi:MAG: Hpt domain-containing protein [Suipraeoptans sp.]